jgi:lipoprotein-anchoring transpeptidase ErfK/SrfK
MWEMDSRVIAASLLAVVGMVGTASAQYQYYPQQPSYGQPVYRPGYVLVPPGYAPPPGYVPAPGYAQPAYRDRQLVENEDDGDPGYGAPRPPSTIQRDALPPPAGANAAPQYGAPQYAAPQYQEPAPPPGYAPQGYGGYRPPGEVGAAAAPPPGGYAPAAAGSVPAPGYGAPPTGYAQPTPGYGTGQPQQNGYAAFGPDYQPEIGKPKELPVQFRRQLVDFQTKEPVGTLIIDTPNTYLYLVLANGKAIRYGIGVGREGFTWAGREKISRMSEWPDWHPPKEMIERQPYLPRFMAGGESNPLGARALYLGSTLYRIHGTNQPSTIGTFVSSGCIRLTNDDISDLFARVQVGTKVVVWPRGPAPETTASVAR